MTSYEALRNLIEIAKEPRRKVFVSHSHLHEKENNTFLVQFGDVFVAKGLGVGDNDEFINSTDTDYVMRRIRELYLEDSTVTIVLIGACAHSRRYLDWEIKASLQKSGDGFANGLLGITLPSTDGSAFLPERFKLNWDKEQQNSYALYHSYPTSKEQLRGWIEEAFQRRQSHTHLIKNSQDKWGYNGKCSVCEITHK